MQNGLNAQTLSRSGAPVAIFGVDRYALPVRFRSHGSLIECCVPTWSGVGDLLAEPREVTLVAVVATEPAMRWLFFRGPGMLLPDPDWAGFSLPFSGHLGPDDLYHLVGIRPKRIELVDEHRGWGVRETADL